MCRVVEDRAIRTLGELMDAGERRCARACDKRRWACDQVVACRHHVAVDGDVRFRWIEAKIHRR